MARAERRVENSLRLRVEVCRLLVRAGLQQVCGDLPEIARGVHRPLEGHLQPLLLVRRAELGAVEGILQLAGSGRDLLLLRLVRLLDPRHLRIVRQSQEHLLQLARDLRALVVQLGHHAAVLLLVALGLRLQLVRLDEVLLVLLLGDRDLQRQLLALQLELDHLVELRLQLLQHLALQLAQRLELHVALVHERGSQRVVVRRGVDLRLDDHIHRLQAELERVDRLELIRHCRRDADDESRLRAAADRVGEEACQLRLAEGRPFLLPRR
mmetsp:Transcript_32882/g.79895  ORF Transcript_32882/g.79895 Transcript_32882/m.79895 type:complete len:268 (-) Transcript_32882:870-1673(-)